MTHKGAAVLVGVNGLLALEAIDKQLLQGLLDKSIKLEGSDRYNMHTGEWIEYTAMSNDRFKDQYGCVWRRLVVAVVLLAAACSLAVCHDVCQRSANSLDAFQLPRATNIKAASTPLRVTLQRTQSCVCLCACLTPVAALPGSTGTITHCSVGVTSLEHWRQHFLRAP